MARIKLAEKRVNKMLKKRNLQGYIKKKEKARFSISKNTRVFYGAKINKNPKSWKVGNGLF